MRFIDERGLEMFRKYEQKAFLLALQLFFENKFKNKQKTEKVLEKWKNIIQTKGTTEFIRLLSKELNEAIEIIRLLEKSIGQMRKARAGVQFQKVLNFCLVCMGSNRKFQQIMKINKDLVILILLFLLWLKLLQNLTNVFL